MANSLEKFFLAKIKMMPPVEVDLTQQMMTKKIETPPKKVLPPGSSQNALVNTVIKTESKVSPIKTQSSPLAQTSTQTSGVKRKLNESMENSTAAKGISTRRESSGYQPKRPNKELPEDQPQHGTTKFKGKLSDSMKFCNEVLRDLFHKRHQAYAWPFYKPVDALALGLHDYHKVITRPMDLGTVKAKMDQREYSDVHQFAEDIRIIFGNCYKYNPEGHDVVQMARKLSEVFENRLKNCPPEPDPNEPSPMKQTATPGRMSQGHQRTPQSQVMSRSFQPKQQQQHAPNTGHLSQDIIKPEMKQEAVEVLSESEIDRETRLDSWNRRLIQVQEEMRQLSETLRALLEEASNRKSSKLGSRNILSNAYTHTQNFVNSEDVAASGLPTNSVSLHDGSVLPGKCMCQKMELQ